MTPILSPEELIKYILMERALHTMRLIFLVPEEKMHLLTYLITQLEVSHGIKYIVVILLLQIIFDSQKAICMKMSCFPCVLFMRAENIYLFLIFVIIIFKDLEVSSIQG